MPQDVRRTPLRQPDPLGRALDDDPARLPRDPTAARVEEYRVGFSGGRARPPEREPAAAQVGLEGPRRTAPERDHPLFVAFDEHAQNAVFEVKVGEVERDRLTDADSRAVQQLEERSIALRKGFVTSHRV